MIKSAEQVGQIIKEQRAKINLTQEQLASRVQISGQAVSKWEKGESYPDIQQLGSLCEVFGVSMDYLMNDSTLDQLQKKEYRVFEKIKNDNCQIEISDISPQTNFNINFSILNKTGIEVSLKPDYFLLLDTQGNMIEPKNQNVSNYDDVVLTTLLLHKIPSFIPPRAQVQVSLVYSIIDEAAQLWINIPNLISGTYFTIHANAHKTYQPHDLNVKLNRNELIDFYNFRFFKGGELNLGVNFPKISKEIIDELIFEKTPSFYKDHQQLFETDILEAIACVDDFVDWNFTKKYVQDPQVLREIVKNNFKKIEEECALGKCSIIKVDSFQEYMDQEIVEFLIMLRVKYAKNYSKWTLDYINDKNIGKLRRDLVMMDYIKNTELFESKVSNKTINEIIRASDVTGITEHHVLKLKTYFKELIDQETMDFLLSKLPVENIETLTKFKQFMSSKSWLQKKEEFFAKEQKKLDSLKEQI